MLPFSHCLPAYSQIRCSRRYSDQLFEEERHVFYSPLSEPRTRNSEPRTRNSEPRTRNSELGTQNSDCCFYKRVFYYSSHFF
ncbi:MAG: hypothetical protein MI674_07580 [Cytophagales bacterium]|nr:hypothetical protein [Cytophagales bacterium]